MQWTHAEARAITYWRYFNRYVRTAGSTDVLARLSALEVVPVSATSTINERLALAGARVIEPPSHISFAYSSLWLCFTDTYEKRATTSYIVMQII